VQIAALTESTLVHRIGHVGVLYKPRKDAPGIVIPAA
jgi:RNA-binding protein YhbY